MDENDFALASEMAEEGWEFLHSDDYKMVFVTEVNGIRYSATVKKDR